MVRRKKKVLKRKKKSSVIKTKRFSKLAQHGYKALSKYQSKVKGKVDIDKGRKDIGMVHNKRGHEYRTAIDADGLSPKEKNFIICECQNRVSRYKSLKLKAAQAIRENKLFCIVGYCNAIRNALLQRGWVEKLPVEKMNLAKIRNGTLTTKSEIIGEVEQLFLSNLVIKHPPNFIWRSKDEHRDVAKENLAIVNRLKTDALWTSKHGLCCSMKRNYWFYIEDVAEVIGPRSYSTGNRGEVEGFVKDYKITACTSLLKWVLSMLANDRPIFVEEGKISLNVVLFALCRCKEYLYRKENKDIDGAISNASIGQWNSFLKKYYRIIGKNDVFQKDTEEKLPLYMAYAKFLLKQMHRYRPQISCEGCHNIWIIKPAHMSRGRGIRLASRLTIISEMLSKASDKFVIQKYIEEPLLIHETKFDIRQYCLVTSTFPLEIWMYQDCYLKFCSQKYNLKNYHESIHLTNNAVQRKYNNCKGRHEELPIKNMWHSEVYKDYLVKIDKSKVWDKIIYPGMKKSIVGIILTCQDALPVSKNRFELYGCDFILDKEYKPWLIEINSSPDLNPTTPVTAKICPDVLSDIIKVVIDRRYNASAPTGKFECIYRQPMTTPKFRGNSNFCVRGISLPNDYFFKGNIDLRECYDCEDDIEKENSIKALLQKIKQNNDIETIMMVPDEDDSCSSSNTEQVSTTRHSWSDKELSTSVVTSQLEEFMDRNSSGHTFNLKSDIEPIQEDSVEFDFTSAQSVSDINAILDNALEKIFTLEDELQKKDFNDLDGGPLNQKGIDEVYYPYNKLNSKIEPTLESSNSKESAQDYIFAATEKLINFINKKEQEYSTDHSSLTS